MLYKFCFYVPLAAVEKVKFAVFATGAGRIGDYDQCCWQSEGRGQFRALEQSNPVIGEKQQLTFVDEVKVEMVCEQQYIKAAVHAMVAAHPYEEPAYQCWPVLGIDDLDKL